MDDHHRLALLNKSATQYRWAVANIIVALLCPVLAAGAFMYGYVVAGLLILVISGGAVWNADAHRRRGMAAQEEAEQE